MYVCLLGIPKDKFSKQMEKKILSYRIIRIKHIFCRVYWCITWTNRSLTNLHKSLQTFICLWVNWSKLYINKLRKKCVWSYNNRIKISKCIQYSEYYYIVYVTSHYLMLSFIHQCHVTIWSFLMSLYNNLTSLILGK